MPGGRLDDRADGVGTSITSIAVRAPSCLKSQGAITSNRMLRDIPCSGHHLSGTSASIEV
jgi:hypothetical protein